MTAPKANGYAGFDYGKETNPDGTTKEPIKVVCFPSDTVRCTVVTTPSTAAGGSDVIGFYSPKTAKDFHDETVIKATREINDILTCLVSASKFDNIHILSTTKGPMLAFTYSVAEYMRNFEEEDLVLD